MEARKHKEQRKLYERIATLEAQVVAMKDAQVIFNQNLREYKVQSNEWRGENQDLVARFATNDYVDAKFMTSETADGKYVTKEKADSQFKTMMYGLLLLAALMLSLFTFLR